MIHLDFLEAADGTPLTKQFRQTAPNAYEVTPYPMLRNFNSHRVEVDSIEAFYYAVVRHAKQNHCLVKGMLARQIADESRQGLTDPSQPTQWICLDLDFDEGWNSIDEFIDDLDPSLSDVSYVFQHSASSGIKARHGLRGHIFMMLDTPIAPSTLKVWLKARNLDVDPLVERFQLSANGQSLRWPLDITTCQNDKLLYIAPPVCENFADPLTDRFTLVRKARDVASRPATMANLSPSVLEHATQTVIAGLREAAGLPKAKPKTREYRSVEYLANPDKAVVSEVRVARGYVYLNLNGGDSWGYYFPENNPEFLYNFKGEPTVRLRDLAPEFYYEYKEKMKRESITTRDFIPIVFRDQKRDIYYNGKYYPATNTADITRAGSVQKLQHFMMQFGEPEPEIIEDWKVDFDPTTFDAIDVDRQWVNCWQPTQYLREGKAAPVKIPRVIHKLIRSICVDDQEVIDHFLNWLAYIVQTRSKTGTAWVFHGVSGTGKGVFFSQVLRPIFGPQHALEYTGAQLEDSFNGPLEQAIILWIDEFHYESARSGGKVMNMLKNLITESMIPIRYMRQETMMLPNFTNVIIATNHPDPVRLAIHDRRFNVAPGQETPIGLTSAEYNSIKDELPVFTSFLMNYTVDVDRVRTVLKNAARENMIQAAQTSVEKFFDSIRSGDLAFFLDFMAEEMPMQDTLVYTNFQKALTAWSTAAARNAVCFLSLDEIRAAYQYIIGTPIAPAKIKRMLSIHRLLYQSELGGIATLWEVNDGRLAQAVRQMTSEKPQMKLVT